VIVKLDFLPTISDKWSLSFQLALTAKQLERMEKESHDRRSSLACMVDGGRFFGIKASTESLQIEKFLGELTRYDHVLLYFHSTWKARKKDVVSKAEIESAKTYIHVIEINVDHLNEVADYYNIDLAPTVCMIKDTRSRYPSRYDFQPTRSSFKRFLIDNAPPRTNSDNGESSNIGFLTTLTYYIFKFIGTSTGQSILKLILSMLYYVGCMYVLRNIFR